MSILKKRAMTQKFEQSCIHYAFYHFYLDHYQQNSSRLNFIHLNYKNLTWKNKVKELQNETPIIFSRTKELSNMLDIVINEIPLVVRYYICVYVYVFNEWFLVHLLINSNAQISFELAVNKNSAFISLQGW